MLAIVAAIVFAIAWIINATGAGLAGCRVILGGAVTAGTLTAVNPAR